MRDMVCHECSSDDCDFVEFNFSAVEPRFCPKCGEDVMHWSDLDEEEREEKSFTKFKDSY